MFTSFGAAFYAKRITKWLNDYDCHIYFLVGFCNASQVIRIMCSRPNGKYEFDFLMARVFDSIACKFVLQFDLPSINVAECQIFDMKFD